MILIMNRISSFRRAVGCGLLIISAVVSASSQTTTDKPATASITGKVTLKNKGVAGIVVVAHLQNISNWQKSGHRGTTDQTGSYRITNLPAGVYIVTSHAPSLAREDEPVETSVVVNEGENVEDINFALVPGGVITGRITDADSKPLIEEHVLIIPVDATYIDERLLTSIRTDDRGIYRAYGLRKGKYKVSVGQDTPFPGRTRQLYRQTFYPSVMDMAKATVIEVTEGSETTNVDIIVGRPITTFKVSGRVLDTERGKPLANIRYGVYQQIGDSGGSSSFGSNVTNANGEFRLENVAPGKYAVFIVPDDGGIREDSVSFEVVDRDITDLVIKPGKAASVSGVVTFESPEQAKPDNLLINGWVENSDRQHFGGGFSQPVNPDGSFKLSGLRKGSLRFGFTERRGGGNPIHVVRVERDGVVQPGGLILKDGEQVTGVRLVVKYLTGGIRGEVKIEGDELLPNARLSVWLTRVDDSRADSSRADSLYLSGNSPQLDARRRFMLGGLAAGTYEVNVTVYVPGRPDAARLYKQQVTVTENAVSDVTIVIKKDP